MDLKCPEPLPRLAFVVEKVGPERVQASGQLGLSIG